jgi:hypothetical protein
MKNDIRRSIISFLLLALCAILTLGYVDFPGDDDEDENDYVTRPLEDGTYEEEDYFGLTKDQYLGKVCGPRDKQGRWHGSIGKRPSAVGCYTEIAEYYHGVRHGYTKYYENCELKKTELYDDGRLIRTFIFSPHINAPSLNSTTLNQDLETSSPIYQQLEKTRPWFLEEMESRFNVSPDQFDTFMGQLEALIVIANPQGEDELAQVYDGAIEEMNASAQYGEQVKWVRAIQSREARLGLKSVELRLAIFDRIFSKSGSTYGILQSSYPGFLQQMVALGPTLSSVEAFLNDMDTRMDAMGAVNLADPLVAEVIDGRIQSALEQVFQIILKPAPGPNNGTDDGSESAGKDAYAWSCGGGPQRLRGLHGWHAKEYLQSMQWQSLHSVQRGQPALECTKRLPGRNPLSSRCVLLQHVQCQFLLLSCTPGME